MAKKTDASPAAQALETLANNPGMQIQAELLTKLRQSALSWWSPAVARELWPTRMRMGWLAGRTDLREKITHELTGLATIAARQLDEGTQSNLIDAVVESGNVTPEQFDAAFDTNDVALYAEAASVWNHFIERFPWTAPGDPERELIQWLIETLMQEKASNLGVSRPAILSPLIVRSAIDARAWQEHIPLDVRVAIDGARLRHEWEFPTKPFGARGELKVLTVFRLVQYIPMTELRAVLEAAARAVGGFKPNAGVKQGAVDLDGLSDAKTTPEQRPN